MALSEDNLPPKYKRTGAKLEILAYQCAVRLLRGESPNVVQSSLEARGVDQTERIMDMALKMALEQRRD